MGQARGRADREAPALTGQGGGKSEAAEGWEKGRMERNLIPPPPPCGCSDGTPRALGRGSVPQLRASQPVLLSRTPSTRGLLVRFEFSTQGSLLVKLGRPYGMPELSLNVGWKHARPMPYLLCCHSGPLIDIGDCCRLQRNFSTPGLWSLETSSVLHPAHTHTYTHTQSQQLKMSQTVVNFPHGSNHHRD